MKKKHFCNLVMAVIDFNNITTILNIKACRSVFSSSSVSTDPLWGFNDEVSRNSTVDFNFLTIHYVLPVVLFCSWVMELSNCKNLDKHRQDMRAVSHFFPVICNGHIWVAYESNLLGFLQFWMICRPHWKKKIKKQITMQKHVLMPPQSLISVTRHGLERTTRCLLLTLHSSQIAQTLTVKPR